jgi:glucokinase
MASSLFLVLDIGGTTLRSAVYVPAGQRLEAVQREPVCNYLTLPDAPVATVQGAVMAQLRQKIASRCAIQRDIGQPVSAVGISFAGPIDAHGRVVSAPTIWGKGGPPLALGLRLSAVLGLPVHAINDVTAAAWRYADRFDEPFCLITVSSGVGNKVFYGQQVLVNRYGFGGEIGHMRVDFAPDALICDCGSHGHLGAIASGRGSLALARRCAREDPTGFAASLLAELCEGDATRLSTYHLVEAALARDVFAQRCVRHGVNYMAQAVAGIYAAIGVRRYLFMGGFALALGALYIDWLAQALGEIGLFGIAPEIVPQLLQLVDEDDNDGLVGAGRYLQSLLLQP